ncbi:MAG: LamG-like jellyroll fold domain-containing protein [Planctomycetota bacterium]|jgi:hypothetical protein
MRHRRLIPCLTGVVLALAAGSAPLLAHGEQEKHPAAVDTSRFVTSRDVPALPLPAEVDAFFFAIFGDRTGGSPAGVRVLEQAVRDVNLLEPDFVMTVGDLVQGYNQTDGWLAQMREYKGVMDGLLCPWFPVAGNHDIYWRGPDPPPPGEHESNYETHFGPLWYAFEHKGCWFIVLYSDEGDPATGEKAIGKPTAQTMSAEQLSWLEQTLARAGSATHVFVFLHHPRWIGGQYGQDWERVHEVLAGAGNVRAVFAGHIHKMRYDGPRDGIEYVTLATTGGGQSGAVPEAGYLHHFHVVTVRDQQIAMSALPVGTMMDVRAITAEVSAETAQLAALVPAFVEVLPVDGNGAADAVLGAHLRNPTSRPIDVTLTPHADDPRWRFAPDHLHETVEPGAWLRFEFRAQRAGDGFHESFGIPSLTRQIDYLAETQRFHVPSQSSPLPVRPDLRTPRPPAEEHVLVVDGRGDYLEVASGHLNVPDGPLTLECRFNATEFGARTGLVSKAEYSEFGIFVSNGKPEFFVFLGNAYVIARAPEPILETGRWHHVAGVFDGKELRLYVDGRLVATSPGSGFRRRNALPLLVGADVNGSGAAMSFFHGAIDGVRLSRTARYSGPSIRSARRLRPDEDTLLQLEMDERTGPWIYDHSGRGNHPIIRGRADVQGITSSRQ